jgi:hypothetical protein
MNFFLFNKSVMHPKIMLDFRNGISKIRASSHFANFSKNRFKNRTYNHSKQANCEAIQKKKLFHRHRDAHPFV